MSQSKILSDLAIIKKGVASINRHFEVGKTNLAVAKSAEQCLAAKFAKGNRKNSLDALRKSLRSLCAVIGDKSIQSVMAKDIEGWLASHADWSPKTRLNNLKYASSLFAWLVRQNHLRRNPCEGVERPKVPFKAVSIRSVDQIEKLLVTCQKSDVALLGYIAPILFGGLRPTESMRCQPETFAKGMIDLGGESCKLNERRCVKISEQLAAWLAVEGVQIGNHKNLLARMAELSKLAEVPLPKNILRHCFCSYSLPIYGVDETARMANNSREKLNSHYLALVTIEDAKRFEALRPVKL